MAAMLTLMAASQALWIVMSATLSAAAVIAPAVYDLGGPPWQRPLPSVAIALALIFLLPQYFRFSGKTTIWQICTLPFLAWLAAFFLLCALTAWSHGLCTDDYGSDNAWAVGERLTCGTAMQVSNVNAKRPFSHRNTKANRLDLSWPSVHASITRNFLSLHSAVCVCICAVPCSDPQPFFASLSAFRSITNSFRTSNSGAAASPSLLSQVPRRSMPVRSRRYLGVVCQYLVHQYRAMICQYLVVREYRVGEYLVCHGRT